jgi:hypothetical protein
MVSLAMIGAVLTMLGVMAAGAASAKGTSGSFTLSCDKTTNPGHVTCVATSANGIDTIAIYDSNSRSDVVGVQNGCSSMIDQQTFELPNPRDRYKVTLTDCAMPHNKQVFIVNVNKGEPASTTTSTAATT